MTVEELAGRGVRAVALVLVDNAGIARMKAVPVDRLGHAAERGVGWAEAWSVSLASDLFAFESGLFTATGDLRLRADLDAARVLGCSQGWGFAPVDHYEQSGKSWPGCQRLALRRQVDRARALGIEARMGWELEWILGREDGGGFEPLRDWTAYGAATFPRIEALLLDLFDALAASGLSPEQIHPEYSTGQIELSLPPRDPLGACDDAVFARHVVRTLAERHGFVASFAPRAIAGSVGSGAHLHASVWEGDANLFSGGDGPAGVRPPGAAFVAGVLPELPALTAVGCPSPLSYARLQPSHWAGVFTCWGNENREAALRLAAAGGASAARSANLEWKAVDGAANPYLAAAGLLGAGLAGIEQGLIPPPPFEGDPAGLSEAERAERGLRRLPLSLADSTNALAASATLREAYGPFLHDRIVAVRRAEMAAAEGADESELVEIYRLRY